jgi:predicted flap endonuclease-1-like 5' DNA nuclease
MTLRWFGPDQTGPKSSTHRKLVYERIVNMRYNINDIEGIGPAYARKLKNVGIKSTGELLKRCAGSHGRKLVSRQTRLPESRLLRWANQADLMRISGVGTQFAELLEAAGVDTVKELRHRKAANLAETMKKVNDRKHLAKLSPSKTVIDRWIKQAKRLAPKISH